MIMSRVVAMNALQGYTGENILWSQRCSEDNPEDKM